MSEYSYYEFQAIDRPLTEAERRELRSFSSRATITSTRFRKPNGPPERLRKAGLG